MRILFICLGWLLSILFCFAQESELTKWYHPIEAAFPVIAGQGWNAPEIGDYHRLPQRAEVDVRTPLWNLSKHAAGLSIHFNTNASELKVKYKLKNAIAMPHMPATGVSGVDLYGKSYNGDWLRYWGSYKIEENSLFTYPLDSTSEWYQLYLPLYNEIDSLYLGIAEGFDFSFLPVNSTKPIVAYGTSICQGACASRPGMAWTNILERQLERPVINLGFSGNGRLEPELIDLVNEIDAAVVILDCLPNLSTRRDDVFQLVIAAVKKIRVEQPKVPIVLTEHPGYSNEATNKEKEIEVQALNAELQKAYQQLIFDEVEGLYILTKDVLNLQPDHFVDHIHPSDLGMRQYAIAYSELIRSILD